MEEAKEKLELEQNIEKKKVSCANVCVLLNTILFNCTFFFHLQISDEEKRIESLNLKRSELQKQLDLVKQVCNIIEITTFSVL